MKISYSNTPSPFTPVHEIKIDIDATPAEMKEISDMIKKELPGTVATPMNLIATICMMGGKSLG